MAGEQILSSSLEIEDNTAGSLNAFADTLERVNTAAEGLGKTFEGMAGGGEGGALAGAAAEAPEIAEGMFAAEIATKAFEMAVEAAKEALHEAYETTIGFTEETEKWSIIFDHVAGAGTGAALVAQARESAAAWGMMPETILSAQERLEGFGLSGEKNLKMVADASAGTGRDMDTIARSIGTLYGNLNEGLPISRFAMQLERSNVLSVETVGKLKEMEKSGGDADEAWKLITADLEKFNGAADEQAHTLEGSMNRIKVTMEDSIGTMFAPLGKLASEGMDQVANALQSPQVEDAVMTLAGYVAVGAQAIQGFFDENGPAIAGFVQQAGEEIGHLGDFVEPAIEWGFNTVDAFAEGIAKGEEVVASALEGIVSIVEWFLAAFSPPKSMPWLRDSGRKTMEEWLSGVSDANLKVFDELAGQIQTDLDRMFDGAKGEGVAQVAVTVRGDLAELVNQFQTTGSVSGEMWDRLRTDAGAAGDSIVDYAQKVIDLTQAENDEAAAKQEEIELNRKYDEQLRPLQEKEKELSLEQMKADDAKKEKQFKGSPAERSRLQEQDAIKEQIAQLELEKTKEMDGVKAKEDSAQKTIDALKPAIDQHKDYGKAIDDVNGLIDKYTEAAGGGGGGAAGATHGFTGKVKDALPEVGHLGDKMAELEKKMKEAHDRFDELGGIIKERTPEMVRTLGDITTGAGHIASAFDTAYTSVKKLLDLWNSGASTLHVPNADTPLTNPFPVPGNPNPIPGTDPNSGTIPIGGPLPGTPGFIGPVAPAPALGSSGNNPGATAYRGNVTVVLPPSQVDFSLLSDNQLAQLGSVAAYHIVRQMNEQMEA